MLVCPYISSCDWLMWITALCLLFSFFKRRRVLVLNVSTMGKDTHPVLDAKHHVCARRDKSNLESRFINIIKGYGVFTTALIQEGTFIVEYRGVLREAGQCIPDAYSYYFIYNNTRYCIDASVDDGSLGRLVNDDNNPNAKVKIISVNRIPHLCLFALRDIQPGEEITYDYGGYDLPWRRGTWLCMGNLSQFDDNESCEEPPAESDTTEQKMCEEDVPVRADQATQTDQECDVPMQADKATQTTEQNTSAEQMIWNHIPYQSLTSKHQKLCENQLLQIQLTPVTKQLPCENEEKNQISEEADQMTDEVDMMECNEETEQISEQQQTCRKVEPCVDVLSCPLSAAQSMSKEEQPTCQVEPCQKSLTEQSSEAKQELYLSSEESNDEMVSSDDEFLPDSESEMDDDSEIETPEKRTNSSVTLKTKEEQAIQPENNQAATETTSLNFCFICGKPNKKIARHFKLHMKDNAEIAAAFKLRKNSKERAEALKVLRNRGNYQHNAMVLSNGTGLIKVRKRPKDTIDTNQYEYCMYCKRLSMRKELWNHVKRCTANPERYKVSSHNVLGLAALSQCPHVNNISEDVKKMLCDMHQDEVAETVRNDEYVLKLAQDFFNKKGKSKEGHAFVRHTVRCVGRFLILLRNRFAIRNLAEAIKPSNFSLIILAVKEISEFDEDKKRCKIPSLARRIGLSLRKYCILSAQKAFEVGDKTLMQATRKFMELFKNAQSQFALGGKKLSDIPSAPFLLPFVNKVRVFHCYLEKAAQSAMKELKETQSIQSYTELCKVTLAQILMFNRRHGKVWHLTIKNFQDRHRVHIPEVCDLLTGLEKVFSEEYCKILVRQTTGELVPIILTPDMINAILLLIEKRDQCSVSKTNLYLFGQPSGNQCFKGENALRICANKCVMANPDELTSTKFSRHISTLSQILTLKNYELNKLSKFIGHNISLRKEYYRQPEAAPRLAKICKLILAIEKGSAAGMLGQSLDDIVLPDEIKESDSEDEYFKEDNAFFEEERLASYLQSKVEENLTETCKITPQNQENESVSKEQENESTSEEQNGKSTTEELKGNIVQQQAKQRYTHRNSLNWTREERNAIMKHFRKHIYYGRLASVKESQRCQMMEHPVLSNRSIQKIRDFVRNAGITFRRKITGKSNLKKNVTLPLVPTNPNSTSVQSPQSSNSSTSSEPSSQMASTTSSSAISSLAANFIKPIILFSQTAKNTTILTPTSPQATFSTTSNVVHPQTTKLVYIKVQGNPSANQTTSSLLLPSQAGNPIIIPARVVLPQTLNSSSISSTDVLTAGLINTSIKPNHTGP